MLAFAIPASMRSYTGSEAVVFVLAGAAMVIIGSVTLLTGISRAAAGIDYLVWSSQRDNPGPGSNAVPSAAAPAEMVR